MEMTIKGEVTPSPISSYVTVLKEEPRVPKIRVSVVQDLVMFAVHGGE